ncbi:MAG: O-antigen ligase family protein [Eubacteriales bacterium]|nr:O-antigen ligase family protein [Eubacteriales bacterium]
MSKQQSGKTQQGIRKFLPQIILLLFVLQPVMDVVSYWLTVLEIGTTITLLVRTAVLVFTVLLGFALSHRKRAYILLASVLFLLAAGHAYVCLLTGYADPFEDLSNYIRVIQLPLFTFCFITFLRESGEDGYRMVERGFVINFAIIVAVEVLSTITGTDPHTYANKSIGVMGWFYWPNTQSAIITAIIPISMAIAARKKNIWWLVGATAVSFAVLYLFATRLTYLAIFVCAAGVIIVLFMSRGADKKKIAVLLAGAVLCGVAYPISPTHKNQLAQQEVALEAQQEADEMIAAAEKRYHTTAEESPELCLLPVYEEHLDGMLERFGTQRVMEAYDYTSDVTQLKDWRRMKILFCQFLMNDTGTPAHIFGLEVSDMMQDGRSYDVENDFHGIYYLYGIVGLALLAAFLLYFVLIIIRALLKDFSRYMTIEAGGFGISFCLMLVHIYFTASILRRNNASFYLSVVLAVIYYFVKIRQETGNSPRA